MQRRSDATTLSVQTIQRLPYYLDYLRKLEAEGCTVVSAPTVAAHFKYGEIQVRKDFAAVCSSSGRPRQGFDVKTLISDIESVLGYNNSTDAVLVGAGSLGHALLSYEGFRDYGLNIVAAFDVAESVVGTKIKNIPVFHSDEIVKLCKRMNIHIGIITVPAAAAQSVCNLLIEGGVRAIWNFSPVHLNVPEGILIQNENMAASLAVLSRALREVLERESNVASVDDDK
ncbi:MAG TPA: redox-sensing transcriptional repressor Rex [Bacillota bacterium]|mgnify:CR=1 FL=1|nr:redox-sensing transcriptional repressor Rex [Bacillota bacterium]HPU18182.1 redox-sensing transcriptional repressor Rex [Bacillota bacterium]